MTRRLDSAPASTCVWMDAGVLRYRLCDRAFDCEHCLLDAALRGSGPEFVEILPSNLALRQATAVAFPADRRYSEGHTWLKRLPGQRRTLRVGLDAFGAMLIARPRHVCWTAAPEVVQPHDSICAIELGEGMLTLGAPLAARLTARNRALDADPGAVVAEPYGDGWLVDLAPLAEDGLAELLSAETAQQRARLDLRRLRRRLALHLLSESPDCELPDDGWCVVDGGVYLQFMRELVH